MKDLTEKWRVPCFLEVTDVGGHIVKSELTTPDPADYRRFISPMVRALIGIQLLMSSADKVLDAYSAYALDPADLNVEAFVELREALMLIRKESE